MPPPAGGWRQTRDEERRRIISRGCAFDSRRLSIDFRRTVALATVGRGQQDRRCRQVGLPTFLSRFFRLSPAWGLQRLLATRRMRIAAAFQSDDTLLSGGGFRWKCIRSDIFWRSRAPRISRAQRKSAT